MNAKNILTGQPIFPPPGPVRGMLDHHPMPGDAGGLP